MKWTCLLIKNVLAYNNFRPFSELGLFIYFLDFFLYVKNRHIPIFMEIGQDLSVV